MNCPSCGGDCWDNTEENIKRKLEGKKERPQYSCKDKEGCGWVMWPDKKGTRSILKETGPLAIIKPSTNGDLKEKTMLMSYAKDLVVAMITRDQIVGQVGKEVVAIYNTLLEGLIHPLGKV